MILTNALHYFIYLMPRIYIVSVQYDDFTATKGLPGSTVDEANIDSGNSNSKQVVKAPEKVKDWKVQMQEMRRFVHHFQVRGGF